MNVKLLIDGIVRQTTILIAQLSTASGARAPLAHVADQVFLELAREIESQGVRRQVVADMFGMALRSYQKKMQRLVESVTVRDRTLWEAVLQLIEKEQPTRERVMRRFEHDGEREVAAVLKDLIRSGLVNVTGNGDHAIYGVTSDATRQEVQRQQDKDSIANVAWLKVFRREAVTRRDLEASLAADATLIGAAIDDLVASGRVVETEGELRSSNVVLSIGATQGWEAAILDHYRTVAVSIATKLAAGLRGSDLGDRIGGSTFTFTVAPGHPFETEVYTTLRRVRTEVQDLWDRVASHNEKQPPASDDSVRVSFYCGQTIEADEDEKEEEAP